VYNIESNNNIISNYSKNMFPFQKLGYYTCNELKEESELNNKNKNKNKNKLNAWILDSGTTYHMTGDLSCLSNISKFNREIYFANGESVKSKFIGTYNGYINDNKITLKNVLFVPVFKKNLISIDCLSDQNYKTVFQKINNKNNVSIYKKNNKICSTSANNSKTYILWTSKNKINFYNNYKCNSITSNNEDENLYTWHRRLGHYNIHSLRNILTKINNKSKCKICAHSKLKNFPYHSNVYKASEPFERIHLDTVSLKQPSLYGNQCFLTILDDFSRYGWVLFCKSKGDIFNVFTTWYNKVKNIFNKNIKYLHSDNGTELINNKFNEFCNFNGIIFEHTIPYNAQQNAHLNHVFWENAIKTANFIHNRIPHKGINNNIPYELLYNEKVDFNRFRVFGCQVFFYVPKSFRKKLSNSALWYFLSDMTRTLPLIGFMI